jgi:hypothetical protein
LYLKSIYLILILLLRLRSNSYLFLLIFPGKTWYPGPESIPNGIQAEPAIAEIV